MSDEVDVRISPTLHPGISAEIADYDDDTRPLLGATETAVSEAFNALKSVHDAKAAAATNPTLNEFAQLIAVDNHATKLMSKVYASWSRTTDVLNNNIAAMEKDLYAPVEQRANASMASEIRAHFKGLKQGERMFALKTAIDNGDEVTATAILGGKHFLSGLDADLHAEYLRDWHNAQRPVEAKKIRAMRQAADMLNERYKLLTRAHREAVGVIEETAEGRRGEKMVVRIWTPDQVRERVRAANEPFAVPV